MASWSKDRVEPNAINGGREFTTDDNLALNELNAIVNNSFYATQKADDAVSYAQEAENNLEEVRDFIASADETSKDAKAIAENAQNIAENAKTIADEALQHAISGSGTMITIDGSPQTEWDATFVEKEKKNSINLIGFPYVHSETINGFTASTENNLITIKGTAGDYSATIPLKFAPLPLKLKAGTYRLKAHFVNGYDYYTMGNNVSVNLANNGMALSVLEYGNTITFNNDVEISEVEVRVEKWVVSIENLQFNLQLEKGTVSTAYVPYVGDILHSGEQPALFAESERQKTLNLCNNELFEWGDIVSGGTLEVSSTKIIRTSNYIPVKPNTKYFVGFGLNSKNMGLKYYSDKNLSSSLGISNVFTSSSTYTTPAGCYYLRICSELLDTSINITQQNFYLYEGTTDYGYLAYNGAIVHEKQLTNYEIIQGKNIEAVTNSSLTSLLEYVNYFNKNDSITYVADIGTLQTSNLKTLLGTPEGMSNYVSAFISKCLEYTGTSNLRYAFKVQAIQSFSNKFAIGYIYQTGGTAYFTGWTVLN